MNKIDRAVADWKAWTKSPTLCPGPSALEAVDRLIAEATNPLLNKIAQLLNESFRDINRRYDQLTPYEQDIIGSDASFAKLCDWIDEHGGRYEAPAIDPLDNWVSRLEQQMQDTFVEANGLYIDVVRLDAPSNLYYVAMRGESRCGIAEWRVSLDESSLFPTEFPGQFHEHDFPDLIYRRRS